MAVYITGDTHGGQDRGRLWQWWGSVRKSLTREDVLIIAGDCGVFWVNDITADFRYWLQELGCTVLFIDGNHDDHMKLHSLQSREMYGADVGVAGDHLFHLRRGRIYRIDGLSVFCFGGGQSIDRARRKPYVDWWEEEVPSQEEFERAVDSLISADWKVDIVLTHTAPGKVLLTLPWVGDAKRKDPTTFMLNRFLDLLEFRQWYCGHFHVDVQVERFRFLFNDVIQIPNTTDDP